MLKSAKCLLENLFFCRKIAKNTPAKWVGDERKSLSVGGVSRLDRTASRNLKSGFGDLAKTRFCFKISSINSNSCRDYNRFDDGDAKGTGFALVVCDENAGGDHEILPPDFGAFTDNAAKSYVHLVPGGPCTHSVV
ncbi:MAG: hypothetical protein JKY45_09485 [Emcibacter sp.]|nr:hypothetical protein [Emcibacter sp.]